MASMGQKYLVVSDNHGNMSNLEYVIERFRGKIEALIHCGDMEIPPEMLEELAGCPVYMAEGNCDYNFSRDKEDIFELGDHVAFVTHGDAYGVSWGEEELVSKEMCIRDRPRTMPVISLSLYGSSRLWRKVSSFSPDKIPCSTNSIRPGQGSG